MNTPGYALMNWETGRGLPESPGLGDSASGSLVGEDGARARRSRRRGYQPARAGRAALDPASPDRAGRTHGLSSLDGLGARVLSPARHLRRSGREGWDGLRPWGWYNEDYQLLQATKAEPIYRQLRNQMVQAGVPIEFSKGEAAPGQHEVNIHYDHALESADGPPSTSMAPRRSRISTGARLPSWPNPMRPGLAPPATST